MNADEYIVDNPRLREFIAHVRATVAAAPPEQALEQLRSAFAAFLADQTWLPAEFQQPISQSGMGGGIATWLLFRSGAGNLSLSSLVVPPGAATPIHDHLAWGMVGLYAGEQDEEVFQHHTAGNHGSLELTEQNHLKPGDFYVLLPPDGDIHRVLTTSEQPSISIHLLGNDIGCTPRHTYGREDGSVSSFRSGWSNVACREKGSEV
jgi:predicted metal-dependent enzyme (double-stranded beta helix superfamily)